jgi:hypothetical protein
MKRRIHLEGAVTWRTEDGRPVSCEEKLKVLNENLDELRQLCQDAFEDALLMECDEAQIRDVFLSIIESLDNPYRKR